MSTARKVVVGVALLAAVYGGASWYMGTKAEPEIRQQVAEFNATVATHYAVNLDEEAVQLKIVNYKRHWFSSDISYELLIDDGQEQYQLLLEDNLKHGPLPVAALMKGRISPLLAYSELQLLPSQNVQPWFEATHGAAPITAHSFIDFNGSSNSQIDLAAVNYQNEFGDEIHMEPATIKVDYKAPTDHVYIDAALPSFVLIDGEDGTHITLKETYFEGSVTDSEQGQSSEAALRVEQLRVSVAETAEVLIDKLSAKSAYSLQGSLLDSAIYYNLASVQVDGHAVGQMELNLDAKRIDYEVIALLSQPELIDELSEAELQPYLTRFFSHKPELKIEPLSWKNTAGESHIIADVKMASTAADIYQQNEVDPAHFFDALDLKVSLSRLMIQGLFSEDSFSSNLVDMLFTRFAQQGQEAGILAYDGQDAKLTLRFDAASNTLILNGKPTDPNDLFYSWLALQMGGGLLH